MAVLGCIADDFTGASDAASFLVKGGMSVRLYNGIPNHADSLSSDCNNSQEQAIVIALKSRSEERKRAVKDSLNAADFLLDRGVKQIYFKYCSTFDSTPQGNIGPVADALMELTKSHYTLLCPSLPVNGRTVSNGQLMVNGVPLDESPMRNHPLNPMWDCRISKLMEPQSHYPAFTISQAQLTAFSETDFPTTPFYLIPDYRTDTDGERIASLFGRLPLLTGGSGLLEHLARSWEHHLPMSGQIPKSPTKGYALLLAGSCSKATLAQIARYQSDGHPCYKLNPKDMLDGRQTLDDAWKFIESHTAAGESVLVYSSDTPEKVKEFQALGKEAVAECLEHATAWLAKKAVESGYTRIITAGGETSGAVTKKLGFSSYWIGESVAPGVPIMVPSGRPDIRLILKSGNFGQEDFFNHAISITDGGRK